MKFNKTIWEFDYLLEEYFERAFNHRFNTYHMALDFKDELTYFQWNSLCGYISYEKNRKQIAAYYQENGSCRGFVSVIVLRKNLIA